MDGRQHERHAFIGVNGTGKSTVIEKILRQSYDPKTQKILIIAETDPPAYAKYKRVHSYEALKNWKSGIVKFYDYNNDPFKMLAQLKQLCNEGYIRNGCVVFEDCTNYVDSNPHREVKSFIVNHRMYDIDLFFTVHALDLLPKFMRKFMHSVTLFKTGDVLRSERDLAALKYQNHVAMYNAYIKAQQEFAKGNKHFNSTVYTGL